MKFCKQDVFVRKSLLPWCNWGNMSCGFAEQKQIYLPRRTFIWITKLSGTSSGTWTDVKRCFGTTDPSDYKEED